MSTQETPVTQECCPECQSTSVVTDIARGDVICSGCGLVRDRIFEAAPSYVTTEVMERSRHDEVWRHGRSTTIAKPDLDASGQRLTQSQRRKAEKLRWWESRKRTADERNVDKAAYIILRVASALSMTVQMVETATHLYRNARRRGILDGRNIEHTVSAVIMISAKKHQRVLFARDVATHLEMAERDVVQTTKWLARELEIKMPQISPRIYVLYLAQVLKTDPPIQEWALEILERVYQVRHLVNGKNPRALAAAAVYLASMKAGQKISQIAVVSEFELTDVAIRGHYQAFMEELGIDKEPVPTDGPLFDPLQ